MAYNYDNHAPFTMADAMMKGRKFRHTITSPANN